MTDALFAMDTDTTASVGRELETAGQQDLDQVGWLQTQINNQMGMPRMLHTALEQFGTKITRTRTDLLNNRITIGKALQNSAIAAAMNEVHLRDSFVPQTRNGSEPFPPDAPPKTPPVTGP